MRRRLALSLFGLLVALAFVTERSSAQSPNITVTVIGSGSSIDEAKSDAVRQALQYALKQLVVVDRAISGDAILRDKVLSTMNGYIEKFQELNIAKSDSGYQVEAKITVSSARIENFIGVVAGGGGAISGPLLSKEQARRIAQAQAEQAQAKARGEIFDRLFREFPWGTLDVTLLKVNISPTNPNILILDMEQSYKPAFLRALKGTLQALADYDCRPISRESPFGGHSKNAGDRWSVREVAGIMVDQRDCLDTAEPGVTYLSESNPHDTVCLGLADVISCFALARGEYCRSCSLIGKRPAIFGRFINSNGQSVLINKDCLVSVPNYARNDESSLQLEWRTVLPSYEKFLVGSVGTGKRHFQIQIDASAVDLQRATHFVAIAGLVADSLFSSPEKQKRVVSLSASSASLGQPQNGCDLVDEAIQHHMASQ